MATKMKIMKLLQEIRGFAEITNRRPQPRSPGLFIVQLRSHMLQTTGPRRKRNIAIDMLNHPDIPSPVKITHVKPTGIAPAHLPASAGEAAFTAIPSSFSSTSSEP